MAKVKQKLSAKFWEKDNLNVLGVYVKNLENKLLILWTLLLDLLQAGARVFIIKPRIARCFS